MPRYGGGMVRTKYLCISKFPVGESSLHVCSMRARGTVALPYWHALPVHCHCTCADYHMDDCSLHNKSRVVI